MTQFTLGYKKKKTTLSALSEQQRSVAMDTQKSSVLKEGFLVKRVSGVFLYWTDVEDEFRPDPFLR